MKGMTEGSGSNFLLPASIRRLRIPALEGFDPATTKISVSVTAE